MPSRIVRESQWMNKRSEYRLLYIQKIVFLKILMHLEYIRTQSAAKQNLLFVWMTGL